MLLLIFFCCGVRVQRPTPAMFLFIVTLAFDLLILKINGFPGLIVGQFYVKFGYPSFVD